MGKEKIKKLKEQLKNIKHLQIRLLCFLALSCNLTAVILMLAFPLSNLYFSWGIHVYIYANLLLVCLFTSICGLKSPDKMKKKIVLISIFLPLLVFVLSLGGVAFAYYSSSRMRWMSDASFYGGVIFSPLTGVFFILIYLSMKESYNLPLIN
jgi:hypothetical protein